jgi:hypothetical protein
VFPAQGEKKPGFPGFFIQTGLLLDRLDVDSLVAFLAGRDVERHFLVFLEALEAVALDCREVREQILAAAVGGDKAETLRVVEPFNGTCTHVYYIPRKNYKWLAPEMRELQGGKRRPEEYRVSGYDGPAIPLPYNPA